jgi:hypothetical protein
MIDCLVILSWVKVLGYFSVIFVPMIDLNNLALMIRIGLIMIRDTFFAKESKSAFPGSTNVVDYAKTMILAKNLLTDDGVFLGSEHGVLG